MSDLARSFDGVKLEEHEAKYSLTRNHENEPSTKSGDIRDRLGEPVSKYEDHRSGRDSRDRERHRSRDRNRERGRSDRDRDRDRRDRRERDRSRPRHREERSYGSEVKKEEGGRPPRETRGRRESPGQQPLRARSRSITPLHKKKRKLQNWDVRPVGYDGMTAEEVKATGHFPLPGQITALKLAGALGVTGSPTGGFAASFLQAAHCASGPAAQNMAMIRQTRRLYVGNIPYAITEAEIAEFFNTAMIQLKLSGGGRNPVVSVSINHEKNYAFVEFSTAEEATAAMAFDGVSFRNQSLKIRRPKDYLPPPGGEYFAPSLHVPGVVSSNVQDTPHKVFIGGVPPYFNEDQVMELLKAFGELRSFNLVKDAVSGLSKGFAFCEYLDPSVTDIACQGLNGMEVGDKKIIMQRASVGSSKLLMGDTPGASASSSTPAQPSNGSFFNPGATTLEVSTVLMFLNMVTAEELENDEEYQEILMDVKEECERFGPVVDIRIPRVKDGSEESHVGKIFVMFTAPEQSSAALRSLAGRKFSERTVLGSYFSEAKFLAGEFV
ncbi:hypothetical protein DSO57_1022294 [Entomophthora muscae]|uniref:Uncharacterized protein n=1 Tax=Entomophthora muscae TaxID=34485 RepID=A0ACC2TQU0_9FUNG|nr:hypothetical protein DSO57_1022294 [Entomophthora muscae]